MINYYKKIKNELVYSNVYKIINASVVAYKKIK